MKKRILRILPDLLIPATAIIITYKLVFNAHKQWDEIEFEQLKKMAINIALVLTGIVITLAFDFSEKMQNLFLKKSEKFDSSDSINEKKENPPLKSKLSTVDHRSKIYKRIFIKSNSKVTESTSIKFLKECIAETESLCKSMRNRESIYLIVGVVFAISGVLFYLTKLTDGEIVNSQQGIPIDHTREIIAVVKRFGMLIFIELIAFFFLKQYRTMLIEFRHYDRIKRMRQEKLLNSYIVEEYSDKPEFAKMRLDALRVGDDDMILKSGESTSSIESQKIVDNEGDMLSRLKEILELLKGEKKG